MNDAQLLRYSRHLLLEQIGIEGQERLLSAKVLIVGAGGLGSPAALYLASAGIGRIALADGDQVDLTNLQRQILHTSRRIGQAKAISGQTALQEINPDIAVEAIPLRLEGEPLAALIAETDVVVDCCDNFATRHAINRACVHHRTPLVSGAAMQFSGQFSVFDSRLPHSPCYNCLFPENTEAEDVRCAVMGVFAPLTGIIGALQAAEAIKVLTGTGDVSVGKLWLFDALATDWRCVRFAPDPDCQVCARRSFSENGPAGASPVPAGADRE